MKRILTSISFALLVPALAWVGGYDFSERGHESFVVCLWTIGVFAAAYTYPRMPK